MSFQDKIVSMMARPGQDSLPKDDEPMWMRYAARGLGTVGGLLAIPLGVWNCTSIVFLGVTCLILGLWQIVAAFFVLCCEAPCCCMFIDHVQRLSNWVDTRPYWNKAAAYVAVALPPIIFCFGASTFIGSGMIFGTGVLYGMMALGKKATAEEMRQAANAESAFNINKPVTMRANLVDHAQPLGFLPSPFDSNV